MIFIFTALYCEARMIIEAFQLEKNVRNTRFQEFYREDAQIRLTITGVGEIAAAAAVAGCCAQYPGSPEAAPEEDFLLNLGICGGEEGMEGVFLCNCLTEQATGKSFYPDMLYRHAFPEAQVVTGMTPWKGRPEYAAGPRPGKGCAGTAVWEDSGGSCCAGKGGAESEGRLYDMEAAAVYQAGRFFFGPHRMMFLKVVSDHGADGTVTAEQVHRQMETHRDDICNYIRFLLSIGRERQGRSRRLLPEEEELVRELGNDLRCSETMRGSLRQYIRYLSLTGVDYRAVIRTLYEEGRLPCHSKREGKQCFEELKRRLL